MFSSPTSVTGLFDELDHRSVDVGYIYTLSEIRYRNLRGVFGLPYDLAAQVVNDHFLHLGNYKHLCLTVIIGGLGCNGFDTRCR